MRLTKKVLLFPLMAMLVVGVRADEINYIDRGWDSSNQKVKDYHSSEDCTPLPSAQNGWVGLYNGWYYITGAVDIQTLNILGDDVNLILCDKSVLTCTGGVKIEGSAKLSIYSQSDGQNMGKLVSHNVDYNNAAGIGCAGDAEDNSGTAIGMGTLIVYGGNIDVQGNDDGAGIGGGEDRGIHGYVTVWGGVIKAQGGNRAAGIGGGYDGDQLGTVTIYGGEVHASGGSEAAGIGSGKTYSGDHRHSADIIIYGGVVEANGGGNGAGIGGGSKGNCQNVTITGGTITATGGYRGAGIGGGYGAGLSHTMEINISGGSVTAKGGYEAAGIGTGYECYESDYADYVNSINISGSAHVYAEGGDYGAGIGTGRSSQGIKVTISDDVVVEAIGKSESAAIGLGQKGYEYTSKPVDYYGGTLILRGNQNYPAGGYSGSTLNIKNGALDIMKVTAGDSEASATTSLRNAKETQCTSYYNGNFYVKIEPCDHAEWDNYEYFNSDRHHKECRFCVEEQYEDHYFINGMCACGEVQSIALEDADDNILELDQYYAYTLVVSINNRTLWKDGSWNTICLPFDAEIEKGTTLEGAKVKRLESSEFDEQTGCLTLTFKDGTYVPSGEPCLIRWDRSEYYDESHSNITGPIFRKVFIKDRIPVPVTTNYVDFVGCFSPENIYSDAKDKLYLGADNNLYYPTTSDFTINAFRGYFQLKNGLKAGDIQTGVNAIVMDFGDGETTSIDNIQWSKDNVQRSKDNGQWYTIDGRKLQGQPSAKGLYIHNGKKFLK